MRKPKDDENIETLGTAPIADRLLDPTEIADAKAAEKVKVAVDPDAEQIGPVKRFFVVTRGGTAQVSGFRTRLREGKEIDNVNYDIRALQRQGIRLSEIDPNNRDEPLDFMIQ